MLTVNSWTAGDSLEQSIDEWAIEAWERMTYGGVNGRNAIEYGTWRAEMNTALRSYAYRERGRNVAR